MHKNVCVSSTVLTHTVLCAQLLELFSAMLRTFEIPVRKWPGQTTISLTQSLNWGAEDEMFVELNGS